MATKSKVNSGGQLLHFSATSKSRSHGPDKASDLKNGKSTKTEGVLIDLNERRKDVAQSEKREVTRTVFSQFMGVFIVLPKWGLQPISIYDISEGGLAFDVIEDVGSFKVSESVTLRIYLSHDNYFTFSTVISNVRAKDGSGMRRHGATFQKDDDSYKTLFFFAKFLENVSLVVRKDKGDKMVGRLD